MGWPGRVPGPERAAVLNDGLSHAAKKKTPRKLICYLARGRPCGGELCRQSSPGGAEATTAGLADHRRSAGWPYEAREERGGRRGADAQRPECLLSKISLLPTENSAANTLVIASASRTHLTHTMASTSTASASLRAGVSSGERESEKREERAAIVKNTSSEKQWGRMRARPTGPGHPHDLPHPPHIRAHHHPTPGLRRQAAPGRVSALLSSPSQARHLAAGAGGRLSPAARVPAPRTARPSARPLILAVRASAGGDDEKVRLE